MNPLKLILFTGKDCPKCKQLKAMLEELQVQFEERDGELPDNKITMLQLGFCTVPLLIGVDEKTNFFYRSLAASEVPTKEELVKTLGESITRR